MIHRSGNSTSFIKVGFLLLLGFSFSILGFSSQIGNSPTRFYAKEEIGVITPDFRIGFDPLGRLGVVQYNKFIVLNDNEWINLIESSHNIEDAINQIAFSDDGKAYFVSNGHWGILEKNKTGEYRSKNMSPEDRPTWTISNAFYHILPIENGVIFYYWDGLVYYDSASNQHLYWEMPGLEQVFSLDGELYVSLSSLGISKLNVRTGELQQMQHNSDYENGLRRGIQIDGNRYIFCDFKGGLFILEDGRVSRFESELETLGDLNISSLCLLADRTLGVAVFGLGIYRISLENGAILSTCVGGIYQNVKELRSNEAGVFWFSTDEGVGKVYYGSGVSIIDQRIGLNPSWPKISKWNEKIVIISSGKIYASEENESSKEVRFETIAGFEDLYLLTAATDYGHFLVGGRTGIYERKQDGSIVSIVSNCEIARLVLLDQNRCIAIGNDKIFLLNREGNSWTESGKSIGGFGFPSVVHRIRDAVWIELGLDRVARLSVVDDEISARIVEEFPWDEPTWVNIGSVGDTVILSGRGNTRMYFDETKGCFTSSPSLDAIFKVSPYGIWRVVAGEDGSIWIAHNQGVSALAKDGEQYRFDYGTEMTIKEPTPVLRKIGKDIWVLSSNSLYKIDPSNSQNVDLLPIPKLADAYNAQNGKRVEFNSFDADLGRLNYSENSLTLRFFAGTYYFENTAYSIRVYGPRGNWAIPITDSQVTMTGLREGDYRLSVSSKGSEHQISDPLELRFTIAHPWYRSFWAYFMYVSIASFVIYLGILILRMYIKHRNRVLMRLVDQKTHELEETMAKLQAEEKNTAINEERHRIAHEIHDSVQQGLSSLRLLLDSALDRDITPDGLQEHLQTSKNVLSFTQKELQHAVWNLESPFLGEGDLKSAVESLLKGLILSGCVVEIMETGTRIPLPYPIRHNMLRVFQETVTNAIEHGVASHIKVIIAYSQDRLDIVIEDNGCGFNVEDSIGRDKRLGLVGLQSRIESIKGKIDFHSVVGEGTRIKIIVPVKHEG